MSTTPPENRHPGIGERLPPLSVPTLIEGEEVSLEAGGRDARVLLVLPADDLEAGLDYWRQFIELSDELRHWYARPLAMLPAEPAALGINPSEVVAPFPVLLDHDGSAHERLDVEQSEAALFIADRYGQVYVAERAQNLTDLPTPRQIEEWVRFLAVQCPECGVIDEPGYGEWAGI